MVHRSIHKGKSYQAGGSCLSPPPNLVSPLAHIQTLPKWTVGKFAGDM